MFDRGEHRTLMALKTRMPSIRVDRAVSLYAVLPFLRLVRQAPVDPHPDVPQCLRCPGSRIASLLPNHHLASHIPRADAVPPRERLHNLHAGCAVERLQSGEISRKQVSITFDDGYFDFLENAQPVLERFGFTSTVYLPTAFIGERANGLQRAAVPDLA